MQPHICWHWSRFWHHQTPAQIDQYFSFQYLFFRQKLISIFRGHTMLNFNSLFSLPMAFSWIWHAWFNLVSQFHKVLRIQTLVLYTVNKIAAYGLQGLLTWAEEAERSFFIVFPRVWGGLYEKPMRSIIFYMLAWEANKL